MKKVGLLISMLAVTVLVACNKKSGGGGEPTTVVPNYVGQACQYNQTPPAAGYICQGNVWVLINQPTAGAGNLLNNVQMQNSYFRGTLFLSATGAVSGGYQVDFNDPRAIIYYAGQVTVTGTIEVLNQSLCGAPVGAYAVSGTANSYYGSLGNGTLTLTGPTGMQLMVYSAQLYNNSGSGLNRDSNANRLGITNSVLTVNGQPCGTITTY